MMTWKQKKGAKNEFKRRNFRNFKQTQQNN